MELSSPMGDSEDDLEEEDSSYDLTGLSSKLQCLELARELQQLPPRLVPNSASTYTFTQRSKGASAGQRARSPVKAGACW